MFYGNVRLEDVEPMSMKEADQLFEINVKLVLAEGEISSPLRRKTKYLFLCPISSEAALQDSEK